MYACDFCGKKSEVGDSGLESTDPDMLDLDPGRGGLGGVDGAVDGVCMLSHMTFTREDESGEYQSLVCILKIKFDTKETERNCSVVVRM